VIDRTLGHYRVLAKLGAGGMGEVYRARDTRLERDVALKVLPESFATDPDRLTRFEREAKLLASLNHPNVAHVYGFEGAKLPDGSTAHFLAMELVEGEDLSERLGRGAIPVEEAISIATQIAEGLEEAHERGIVHRDLKPANVKVTPDGKVKVLDFGLAKALEGDPAGPAADGQLSNSPTLSRYATEAGMIMGTAAYMSPEQARGKAVDKRADIWAFGVLLFEMLTGRRLFAGETVSDVLAAVLTREPDFTTLPPATPETARHVLRRCLERDPRRRMRDIGDARVDLETSPADAGTRAAPSAPPRFASRPAMAVIAALGIIVLALALLRQGAPPQTSKGLTYAAIALPPGHALEAGPEVTRDGERIAFVSSDGLSRPVLYTRRLDEPDLRRLDGTAEANQPFFSPDGRWIAFYARGSLYKVRVDGGEPVRLADAPSSEGGYWLEDDTILFTPTWNSGLYRIDASGGQAKPFLLPDRKSYYAYAWPFVLPGDRALLFTRWGTTTDVMRLELSDKRESVVAAGQWRRSAYTASGHIVFAGNGGDLLALAGDASGAPGTPETVLTNVAGGRDPDGYTRISVSDTGTLVYSPVDESKQSLVLVDRTGKSEPAQAPPASYDAVDVSPDGRRVVVQSENRLFVHDLVRGSQIPLAPEMPRSGAHPFWTPDGSRIVFGANHAGTWDLYSKSASGTGDVELLFGGRFDQYPTAVMRNGTVVYDESHDTTGKDIWLLPPGGKPQAWRVTPANEAMGRASPDDRLMAFISDVSGRYEVYVQPIDRSTDAVAVSTQGGTAPVWSRSEDRLFFRQGNLMMAVRVISRPRLEVGMPEVLFDGGWPLSQRRAASYYLFNYGVMPDGRFLMVKNEPEAVPMRINVIFDWFEALKAKVPVK
jgi:eukaryotic-like serine/threonine-protein kinase